MLQNTLDKIRKGPLLCLNRPSLFTQDTLIMTTPYHSYQTFHFFINRVINHRHHIEDMFNHIFPRIQQYSYHQHRHIIQSHSNSLFIFILLHTIISRFGSTRQGTQGCVESSISIKFQVCVDKILLCERKESNQLLSDINRFVLEWIRRTITLKLFGYTDLNQNREMSLLRRSFLSDRMIRQYEEM